MATKNTFSLIDNIVNILPHQPHFRQLDINHNDDIRSPADVAVAAAAKVAVAFRTIGPRLILLQISENVFNVLGGTLASCTSLETFGITRRLGGWAAVLRLDTQNEIIQIFHTLPHHLPYLKTLVLDIVGSTAWAQVRRALDLRALGALTRVIVYVDAPSQASEMASMTGWRNWGGRGEF